MKHDDELVEKASRAIAGVTIKRWKELPQSYKDSIRTDVRIVMDVMKEAVQ